VGSGVYYPKLVFDYETYSDRDDVIASDTPVARDVAGRCVSLPVHPHLSEDEIRVIADAVHEALA
jgi:dTDP-4-amino-4,6-dideoxygalactose transaminase